MNRSLIIKLLSLLAVLLYFIDLQFFDLGFGLFLAIPLIGIAGFMQYQENAKKKEDQ